MILKVKRLTDTAVLPVKAHPTDAGFDIAELERAVRSELSYLRDNQYRYKMQAKAWGLF